MKDCLMQEIQVGDVVAYGSPTSKPRAMYVGKVSGIGKKVVIIHKDYPYPCNDNVYPEHLLKVDDKLYMLYLMKK